MAVALTFDDGPHPRRTPEVISKLAGLGVQATFFVQGERLAECPDVARDALAQGHELQPHCWRHRSHHELSEDEIRADLGRVLAALAELGQQSPKLWRPPYGHIERPATYDVAAEHGLEVVTWTLQTCDWAGRSAERMWSEIRSEERPSAVLRRDSVVIMHDPVGAATIGLLGKLVPEIRRRGWTVGPLAAGVETPEDPFDDCRV